MTFWKNFGFHSVSPIDSLLESPDVTLEQLLDEEEILQETKSQNKKLLDFLIEPSILKKLVFYITVEPHEEDDPKRRFKYPFLSCEILASEVWAIVEAFYENRNLLDELYSYFDSNAPLNSLLSGYVSRVASVLLTKKVAETIQYLKEQEKTIPRFLKHLGNASVMELLLKVVACQDASEGSGTLEWLCSTELIPSVVEKFNPKFSAEVHENASQILSDIIFVSSNALSSPLIAQLESEKVICILFEYMLAKELSSTLLNGLTVIIDLLRRHISERYDFTSTLESLDPLIRITLENLRKLKRFIENPSEFGKYNGLQEFENQASGKVIPLGFERLKIVELISALVSLNFQCVHDALIQMNVLGCCVNLFFAYPWNNFLHAAVDAIIQTILDCENESLKLTLLKDCNLISKICQASKENDLECEKPRGMRRGYMGFVTSMSQSIDNISTASSTVQQFLSEDSEWLEYFQGSFQTNRERDSQPIGGYVPNDYTLETSPNTLEEGISSDDSGMLMNGTGFEEFTENGQYQMFSEIEQESQESYKLELEEYEQTNDGNKQANERHLEDVSNWRQSEALEQEEEEEEEEEEEVLQPVERKEEAWEESVTGNDVELREDEKEEANSSSALESGSAPLEASPEQESSDILPSKDNSADSLDNSFSTEPTATTSDKDTSAKGV